MSLLRYWWRSKKIKRKRTCQTLYFNALRFMLQIYPDVTAAKWNPANPAIFVMLIFEIITVDPSFSLFLILFAQARAAFGNEGPKLLRKKRVFSCPEFIICLEIFFFRKVYCKCKFEAWSLWEIFSCSDLFFVWGSCTRILTGRSKQVVKPWVRSTLPGCRWGWCFFCRLQPQKWSESIYVWTSGTNHLPSLKLTVCT